VDHFDFFYSLAFLLGSLNSIIIAAGSVVVSCLIFPRVIHFSKLSFFDAYSAGRKAANFQSYFFVGEIIFAMGLFLVMHQRSNEEKLESRS
jgi:hypothetical protein